jgi:membrane associated rhomboid family serine protease
LFSYVYFAPWQIIRIWFIPIPGIIAAIAYLAYSAYMGKKGNDNIGHDAHFWGAVYGFLFTLLFDPTHGQIFFGQLMHPSF